MPALDDPLADRIKRGIATFVDIAEQVGEMEQAEGSPRRVKELEAEVQDLEAEVRELEFEEECLRGKLEQVPDAGGLFQDLEDARRGILDIGEVYDKWLTRTPV